MEFSPSILLIDDDVLMTELIRLSLEGDGYTIYYYNDPLIALEFLKSTAVDLVISDIMMPGLNGIDLLKQVRSFMPQNILLFIILSGKQFQKIDRREIFDLGAEIIEKPFRPSVLKEHIRNIFRKTT